jgi:lipopolysaccharide export LptBFGC system permease protein LptF
MSVVPRTNQAYRNLVSGRLGGSAQLAPGAAEWTFTDLVRRSAGPPPERAAARRQLSSRLLISTAPIMIGFVALGISGFRRKIALFSGVWVLVLYIAAVRSTVASAYQSPPAESVWMVNAIFTIGGLWLVWLRPRPDDSGPVSGLPMP